MTEVWWRVTDFGDSAVVLPLAFFVVVYLVFFSRRLRDGLALALATGGTAFCLLLLKLAFRACINPTGGGIITSPSGHVGMSAVVYGCLALLLSQGSPRRVLLLAATALFVVLIAISRVVLGAHNQAEVLTGLAVGSGFAVAFSLAAARPGGQDLSRRPLLAIALLAVLVTYGLNPPIEEVIKEIAIQLQSRIPGCE